MALSKQQAIALASLPVLVRQQDLIALAGAGGAGASAGAAEAAQDAAQAAAQASGAGGTIAGEAAKTAGLMGQHGPPKKVASGKGEAFYKQPIGALIIPHGTHFVKGQPSHNIYDTSQSKWIANQWKKSPEPGADVAQHAVNEGTHHWVTAGHNKYAVHNKAGVYVPKNIDVHHPVESAAADKLVVAADPVTHEGQHATLNPMAHPGTMPPVFPHNAKKHVFVDKDWKQLPQPVESKKPVSIDGKNVAWIPADWKLYKAHGTPEDQLQGKWAKDPEGKWHFISLSGAILAQQLWHGKADDLVENGSLVPDNDSEPKSLVPHPESPPGPEPAKTDVGGVAVTQDEIQDAIAKLQGSASTQIKGLLKGHPLEGSDYHKVYKEELEKFPGLKVAPGTKKQHVSGAKNAFIHHLAGKSEELAQYEAQAKAAKLAKDVANAVAEHAQKLTPHKTDVGGVEAGKEDIQDAITALSGTDASAIKQTLKAKGNALAASAWWKVVHDYQAKYPNSTKGLGAKAVYLLALHEVLNVVGGADKETGHDDHAELHKLVMAMPKPKVEDGIVYDYEGIQLARALAAAAQHGVKVYVAQAPLSPDPVKTWVVQYTKPSTSGDSSYYVADPGHDISWAENGVFAYGLTVEQVLYVAQHNKLPEGMAKSPAAVAVPEQEKAWKQTADYKDLHAIISSLDLADVYNFNEAAATQERSLARALLYAHLTGSDRFVGKSSSGTHWAYYKNQSDAEDATGVSGYYRITAAHEIVLVTLAGIEYPDNSGQVFQVLEKGGKPKLLPGSVELVTPAGKKLQADWASKQPAVEPAVAKTFNVTGQQEDYLAPAGSSVWMQKAPLVIYVRHPDGVWHRVDGNMDFPASDANAKALESWIVSGWLEPQNNTAKDYASGVGAVKNTPAPAEEPGDIAGQVQEEFDKQVKVYIHGKLSASFPPGTKVYSIEQQGTDPDWKYVKKTDGKWVVVSEDGDVKPTADSYDFLVGTTLLEEQAAAEKAQATAQGVPAVVNQAIVGVFPAGSTLWKTKNTYAPVIAMAPDSSWWYATATGGVKKASSTIYASATIAAASDKIPALSPEDIAHLEELTKVKKDLESSAVDPEKKLPGGTSVWPTWQQALVHGLVNKTPSGSGVNVTVTHAGAGFTYIAQIQHGYEEHWRVSLASLEGQHFPDNSGALEAAKSVPVTYDEVKQAVDQHAVSNAVNIQVAGVSKLYHYGFYTAPHGKASLEVKPSENSHYNYTGTFGSAAKASYVWHATDGSVKTLSPSQAVKHLAKSTVYSKGVPEGPGPAHQLKQAEYATVYKKPGDFLVYGKSKGLGTNTFVVHADGSGLFNEGGQPGIPYIPEMTDELVKGGAILDQFGNTVVKPGVQPVVYHLWGSPDKSRLELQGLLAELEKNAGEIKWMTPLFESLGIPDGGLPASEYKDQLKAFIVAADAISGHAQYLAVTGLVRELLQVPEQKAGWGAGPEPVYLKGLPAGIGGAKDVFKWTGQGYAVPFSGVLPAIKGVTTFASVAGLTVVQLRKLVKSVSAQFGDGKVVGTHLFALPGPQLRNWLVSWAQGDMQGVFSLDSKGGKVSTAHPGAPGNPDTHHITWAPADPSQVPASEKIAGDWTIFSQYAPSKAEVANYLIAVGVQHAEYLSDIERRELVTAHQNHAQGGVDLLTKSANARFTEGQDPKSLPPAWTDGVKPAKSYTAHVENNDTAVTWQPSAIADFLNDYSTAVLSYKEQVAHENGYGSAAAVPSVFDKTLVQMWLDGKHAEEVAAKSVPEWKQTFGGSTGPVLTLDKYIPYTGEKTTWFFSPDEPAKHEAASKLGQLLGFPGPEAEVITFEGKQGLATKDVPGELLAPLPAWHQLTGLQVSDIASEHLLDWVLSNDGTSGSDLMKQPNGHVMATSKDRAWKGGDWKGLAGTKAADTHTHLIYSQLFDAIRSHELTKDVADAAYEVLVHHARNIARVPDDQVTALLEQGNAFTPGDTTQVLTRMHSLEKDFGKLWAKVYKDAGWKLPVVPERRLPGGLHSGFSEPEFIPHVRDARMYGVPAFFAGGELENGHVMVWREFRGESADHPELRGELFIRDSGPLKKVLGWVQDHGHQPPDASGIKVEASTYYRRSPIRSYGAFGGNHSSAISADGELHTSASTVKGETSGSAWKITLPTGEELLLQGTHDSIQDSTNTPLAHVGRVQFTASNEAGSASLEHVRNFLQTAGLEMKEAEPQDLELFYWRHLYNVLQDRVDKNQPAYHQVGYVVQQELEKRGLKFDHQKSNSHGGTSSGPMERAGLPASEELAIWHEAWSHVTSAAQVSEWVANGGYLPRMKHFDIRHPAVENGEPDWYRFDATQGQVAQWVPPSHMTSSQDARYSIVRGGGLLSKDAALRVLGIHISDQGNPPDKGATGTVFTALNDPGRNILITPLALARTHTYGWDDDNYGEAWIRSNTAYFDLQKSASYHGIETMFHDGISLLDDIEAIRAGSSEERDAMIKELKDSGITEIRGMPVEDRILSNYSLDSHALVGKLRAHWKQHPELLDPATGGQGKQAATPLKAATKAASKAVAPPTAVAPEAEPAAGDVVPPGWTPTEAENLPPGWPALKPYAEPLEPHSHGAYPVHTHHHAHATGWDYTHAAAISKLSEEQLKQQLLQVGDTKYYPPAGSKVYKPMGFLPERFVKEPDGKWKMVSPQGVSDADSKDAEVDDGTLVLDGDYYAKQHPEYTGHVSQEDEEAALEAEAAAAQEETQAQQTIAGMGGNSYAELQAAQDAELEELKAQLAPATKPVPQPSDWLYSADHSKAAPVSQVSTMFYGQATPKTPSMSEMGKTKGATALRISQDMTSSPDAIAAMAAGVGLDAPSSWGPTPEARTVAALIKTWATGTHMPIALALQQLATELFGTGKAPLPPLGMADKAGQAAVDLLIADYGPVLRDFLMAMWQASQADLSKNGIETISAYRVFHFTGTVPPWAENAEPGKVIDAPMSRPLSSWAFSPSAAENAGTFTYGGYTVLVRATVQAQQVLAYPKSGFGSYPEQELVLLDSPGQWEVVSTSG